MKIRLDESLKRLRAEKGMSQKELADRLSVSPQSVSRWENGQAYPDMEMLPRLADIFRVSVDRLLGRESSFITQKVEELRAAWGAVVDERDFRHRQTVCDILEELAAHGRSQLEFFRVARELERGGAAKPMQVERARQYCREMLEPMDANDRITMLLDILPCEDEGKWDLWRAYAPSCRKITNWDAVLLEQYPRRTEKWERQRQLVLYHEVDTLLYRLLEVAPTSYRQSQLALDTVNLYSKETGDIFLPHRINAEMWAAVMLFGEGRAEEGFRMLDAVAEHLGLAFRLGGTRVRGSIPELSLIQRPAAISGASFVVGGVRNMMNTRKELDPIRSDARFVAFCRGVNALRQSTYVGVNNEEADRLKKVVAAVSEQQANELADGEWLVVLMTLRGEIYRTVLRPDDGDYRQDPPLVPQLIESGSTQVWCFMGIDRFHNVEIPPFGVVADLVDLDEGNRHMKCLAAHGTEFHTIEAERILAIEDERCREAHPFSSNHKNTLIQDTICGCFHCLSIFSPDKIERWLKKQTQMNRGTVNVWRMDGQETAICPHCGIDAVLGESSGFPITKAFLKQMRRYWFHEKSDLLGSLS